ncbi:MAG: hypothetical protein FWG41_02655 [Methanomassiliicoccaceae archaeon]|nr:hypothetical protein [Methanomassiliicoccaceae archaeon]
MVSLEISDEAQELSNAIVTLVELGNSELYVRLEAFLSIVVEYTDFYIGMHKDRIKAREEIEKELGHI